MGPREAAPSTATRNDGGSFKASFATLKLDRCSKLLLDRCSKLLQVGAVGGRGDRVSVALETLECPTNAGAE
jgi:hypothetical protein